MKNQFSVILIMMMSYQLFAQDAVEHVAPSLQLGLNGLSLSKGDLDSQLIIEIVAEKQQELKTKLIENMLLGKVYDKEHGSGMIYNYTTNVLSALLTEPKPDIRTRIVLENTVNAVFAYAFANQFFTDTNTAKNKIVNNLLAHYKLQAVSNPKRLSAAEIKGGYDMPEMKQSGELKKDKSNTDDEINTANLIVAILIDMSSEVLRNNDKLAAKGIMRISYSGTYEYINQYKNLFDQQMSSFNKEKRDAAKAIYNQMEKDLNEYINLAGTAAYLVDKSGMFGSIEITTSTFNIESSSMSLINPSLITGIASELKQTLDSLKKIAPNHELDSLIQRTTEIRSYLTNFEKFKLDDLTKHYQDLGKIILALDREVIPFIMSLVAYNVDLVDKIDDLESMNQSLAKIVKDNSQLLNNIIESPFFLALSKIQDFDKKATYIDYISLLPNLENAFQNEKINYGISLINTFIKDYTTVGKTKKDETYLEVDIESFLVKMQQLRPDHISRWDFHFTVGVNTLSFLDMLKLEDASEISNYSFVGEKIGLKYKFINRGAWKGRHPGDTYKLGNSTYTKKGAPQEPLIDNIHLLAYGSGLLYNLANTGTTSDFNSPIFGVGLGMTFYNDLDLNISYGSPIDQKSSFFNVGFDIQFTEYLSRLNKRRKDNKNQKLIANQVKSNKDDGK